jgi:mannose-1-phosphate guanylyltransferase
MKAFLLAAGLGTRLKPLTDRVPKCLLPIRDTPLLGIWLELCRQHGITDVLVNAHSHAGMVKEYVAKSKAGLSIRVSEEETLLGSAGTLRANYEWVAKEREFFVLYGDVLTNVDLTELLEFHREREVAATIGLYEVTNPSQCGIVTVDQDGMVRDFVEKPAKPASNLAFTGVLIASPVIFEAIPQQAPADIGFDVLPKLIGRMAAYKVTDFLVDIGTAEKYERVQTTWPGLRPVGAR